VLWCCELVARRVNRNAEIVGLNFDSNIQKLPNRYMYIDDAEVVAKAFPDGQLRAIWCAPPKSKDREHGRQEVGATLDKLKACGLNTLFVWTESLYAAAAARGKP
jgi:uncharacterized lipoprotein YddW (UPF0748 family)